jgi:hypothetical protein
MSPQPDDVPEPPHNVPGFGELGEDPEAHERQRVRSLSDEIAKFERPSVIERDRTLIVADQQRRLELTEALKPLIGQAFGQLTQFLADLQHDIKANTEMVAAMNLPAEAVVESHERASVSFETLRKDLHDIGMEAPAAIKDLARVMDTAGLNDAQSRAERRFEQLAKMIEGKLDAFLKSQTEAFKQRDEDMVKILHLLERLQARELREMKRRAGT